MKNAKALNLKNMLVCVIAAIAPKAAIPLFGLIRPMQNIEPKTQNTPTGGG